MRRRYIIPMLSLAPLAALAQGMGTPPNVIYIMCDDMGYGDLGCYGQPFILTPHIDQMAREGMRFTDAYAGSPVSAPSRATLMTGQHTGHCEVRGNKEYWPDAPKVKYGVVEDYAVSGQHPYDPEHIVLTEMMKRQGYRTAMFGKWAGGYEGSASLPHTRGIDRFFGYVCQYQAHSYYPNFLNRYDPARGDTTTVRVVLESNVQHAMTGDDYHRRPQYSADLIHREALRWIGEQQPDGQPFFAMLTYTLPHAELAQPADSLVSAYEAAFTDDKDWAGQWPSRYADVRHTHAQFAAMISRLDAYVGEVFATLRAKGLDSNTLVIFTSDNGPHEEGGADPAFFGRDGRLRGLKRQCYEGGIRVPFIAWWPGRVAAGSESNLLFAFYDIMPTLADLTGLTDFPASVTSRAKAERGEVEPFDGISILPTLLGEDAAQQRHDFLYWEFDETDQMALRQGRWKLVVRGGVPELYDLDADIHEDHDRAAEQPERVAAMVEVLLKEHIPNPHFRVTLPRRP